MWIIIQIFFFEHWKTQFITICPTVFKIFIILFLRQSSVRLMIFTNRLVVQLAQWWCLFYFGFSISMTCTRSYKDLQDFKCCLRCFCTCSDLLPRNHSIRRYSISQILLAYKWNVLMSAVHGVARRSSSQELRMSYDIQLRWLDGSRCFAFLIVRTLASNKYYNCI